MCPLVSKLANNVTSLMKSVMDSCLSNCYFLNIKIFIFLYITVSLQICKYTFKIYIFKALASLLGNGSYL